MMVDLVLFKKEMEDELGNILKYWMEYAKDEVHGGFTGRVNHFNQPDTVADKGSVLNSRILWTFSAAFLATKNPVYGDFAQRAYHYFITHFTDKEHGGVYWSVDYKGNPSDRKKQVYAQSFAIYALSEYYRATGSTGALELVISLFNTIERYSYDNIKGGYIDAFAENWSPMNDLRLSAKDANEKKTMNTHLHVLEAYCNLYSVWADQTLKTKIENLLHNFNTHIIDNSTGHLALFFDENWKPQSTLISYGHDIEAAWLLQEAAETICDTAWIDTTKELAIKLAAAAREGLDTDGGLWYEYDPANHHLVKEKHWWPQAEAVVGFFNAWQISGQEIYLYYALNTWNFIKKHIRDTKHGEWVWGVRADNVAMQEQDKIGIWKCPYHNSRMCLEMIKRLSAASGMIER